MCQRREKFDEKIVLVINYYIFLIFHDISFISLSIYQFDKLNLINKTTKEMKKKMIIEKLKIIVLKLISLNRHIVKISESIAKKFLRGKHTWRWT